VVLAAHSAVMSK